MDLGGWLRSLGLERYEAAFRENEIDDTVLPSLTAEDLKDLGVGIVGLDAIALLRSGADAKAPTAEAPSTVPKPAQDRLILKKRAHGPQARSRGLAEMQNDQSLFSSRHSPFPVWIVRD
jgi:hypothetical protein